MSTSHDERSRRLYRLLLRAFPREDREVHGREMEDAFLAMLRLADERSGGSGRLRCWMGALWDAGATGIERRMLPRARTRAQEGGGLMGMLYGDVRFGVRSLTRRPLFAATALLTIALGIGANASVFTVVNGLLFQSLPYEEPDELVVLWAEMPERGWSETDVNPADAMDWAARSESIESLAVLDETSYNLTGGDVPERVSAIRATPNLFSVLGRAPAVGRDFLTDEVGDGRDGVAILTDGFWERRFARDPSAVGSTLVLDGESVTVVGIMPADFRFLDERPDLFRPLGYNPATVVRGGHYAEALARLSKGATLERAREEVRAVASDLEDEHPENIGWTASIVTLESDLLGDVALSASIVLMTAVGFILLMACVNVANLLLARGGSRVHELGVRAALGAGRGRIVTQLLTESVVLAAAGGALGLLAAEWGHRAIVAGLPSTLPPVFEFHMDATVLAYTLAVTATAAVLFGLMPAVRLSAAAGTLRDGGRSGRGRGASKFGSLLVVTQTALSVVLLVGGGLLVKSVAAMARQDLGFDPADALTVRVSPSTRQYETGEEIAAFWDDVTARVRALPGVASAGTTQTLPLAGSNWVSAVRFTGDGEDAVHSVRLTYASEDLFDALGFELARGRALAAGDGGDAPRVAIVNEAFAARYLGPDDDLLDRTLAMGDDAVPIVGVVRNVYERNIQEPPGPALYLPIQAAPEPILSRSLVLRTSVPPTALLEPVQQAVWAVDGDVPVYEAATMQTIVDRRVGGFQIIGTLMGVFALLSLLLGAVGIYGVTAYAAGQRTGEIGVRLAMGARRGDVVRMVVGHGARRAILGLTIGLGLAFLLSGALEGLLVGVSPTDPAVFGAVAVVLGVVSLLGVYVPALRAARTDPVRALAAE